ncbi:MAG: 2-phospho-L-lactate transferase [Chloroflexota bacterium]
MKVVGLAGGVGGAKLAAGLAGVLAPDDLTVIVNTGDDFEHLGLTICPDLDTVVYTLAGRANPKTGWGRGGESWNFLGALEELGGPTWFRLGDKDLATHIERTQRLQRGERLSAITAAFCRAWGVNVRVLPMSDDRVRTVVHTTEGPLSFQEYFVARHWEPIVRGFTFEGAASARPGPGVLESLAEADGVLFCPSNPWVSLDPILAVPGIRPTVAAKTAVAISPIVGGEAIRGPAAKMFRELGIQPSPLSVAEHFAGLLSGIVIDRVDRAMASELAQRGLAVRAEDTVMRSAADRRRVASHALALLGEVRSHVGPA